MFKTTKRLLASTILATIGTSVSYAQLQPGQIKEELKRSTPIKIDRERPREATAYLIKPEDSTTLKKSDLSFKFIATDTGVIAEDIKVKDCNDSNAKAVTVRFRIIQPSASDQKEIAITNGDVVFDKKMKVPSDCNFTYKPKSLLKDYVPYAWSVTPVRKQFSIWNRFVLGSHLNGLNTEFSGNNCTQSGLIPNPTFETQSSTWKYYPNGSIVAPVTSEGHHNPGAMRINHSNRAAKTDLTSPLIQGESYKINFSMKLEHVYTKANLKVKVFGITNPSVTSGSPSADFQLLTETGFLPTDFTEWSNYSLETFVPTKNYSNLIIAVESTREFSALFDNIGLCSGQVIDCSKYTGHSGLNVESDFTEAALQNLQDQASFQETNLGTVADIYGPQTTLTTDFLDEQRDTPSGPMVCGSVNNIDFDIETYPPELETSSEEEEYFDFLNEANAMISARPIGSPLGDISQITAVNIPAPEIFEETAINICETELDPDLPFGGRDIVYIHGLKKDHLDGNYESPPRFQSRWRENKEEFYKSAPSAGFDITSDWEADLFDSLYNGGEYWKSAAQYWMGGEPSRPGRTISIPWLGDITFPGSPGVRPNKHIPAKLGQLNELTNSFVIINYSTNERLHWGIEATLTQISEAVNDENNNVFLTQKASQNFHEKERSCFGSKGLVLMTHSTGSLLASSMLALSDMSKDPASDAAERYGNIGWLSDNTDLHISFGGALEGSPLASAGIAVMSESIPVGQWLRNKIKDAVFSKVDPSGPSATNPFATVLLDLAPVYARSVWSPIYENSDTPTVMIVDDTPGNGEIQDYKAGQFLSIGFDDGVNSSRSQLALKNQGTNQLALYSVQNRKKLFDLGIRNNWLQSLTSLKAWSMIKQGREFTPNGARRYFVNPNIAPNGMLQNEAVTSWSGGNRSYNNHFPIIQSTASHYDVATDWKDSIYAKVWSGKDKNTEETAVVNSGLVYTKNLISPDLMNSNVQTRKQQSIGFHLPCGINFSPWMNISIEWCYIEWVLWRRNYMNLGNNGPNQKRDVDFFGMIM